MSRKHEHTSKQLETNLDIVNNKLVEAGGKHVPGLLVAAIPNVGHEVLTFEPSAHPVVDPLGLAPVGLYGGTHTHTHTHNQMTTVLDTAENSA